MQEPQRHRGHGEANVILLVLCVLCVSVVYFFIIRPSLLGDTPIPLRYIGAGLAKSGQSGMTVSG